MEVSSKTECLYGSHMCSLLASALPSISLFTTLVCIQKSLHSPQYLQEAHFGDLTLGLLALHPWLHEALHPWLHEDVHEITCIAPRISFMIAPGQVLYWSLIQHSNHASSSIDWGEQIRSQKVLVDTIWHNMFCALGHFHTSSWEMTRNTANCDQLRPCYVKLVAAKYLQSTLKYSEHLLWPKIWNVSHLSKTFEYLLDKMYIDCQMFVKRVSNVFDILSCVHYVLSYFTSFIQQSSMLGLEVCLLAEMSEVYDNLSAEGAFWAWKKPQSDQHCDQS